jgi:hypothetical protein
LLGQEQPLLFIERGERSFGFALTLGRPQATFLDLSFTIENPLTPL